MNDVFVRENFPSTVALDPHGRRHRLANPSEGVQMLRALDQIQAMSGSKRDIRAAIPEHMEKTDDLIIADAIALYYASHSGRPCKQEMARVARILAESRMSEAFSNGVTEFKARGRRALVYPEILVPTAHVAVFLVSTRIWFNNNRSVRDFPANDRQRVVFLEDLNGRLSEGQVSLER